MPISQTDFNDACDDVFLTGETPTIERMRAAIGGGSPGTVGPMLKIWKAKRAEEDALRDIPIPASLADDAALTLARLWKQAMAEATAGHDAMRRDLVAAKAEIATLHEGYHGQLCRMEVDLDHAQTERDAHRNRVERMEAERCVLSDRTARAEAEAASATARMDAAIADVRQARADCMAAESRTDQMRSERDAARREGAELVRAFGQTAGASRDDGCARCAGVGVDDDRPTAGVSPSRETPDIATGTGHEAWAEFSRVPQAAHRGRLDDFMNAISKQLTSVDDNAAMEMTG